MSYRVVTVSGPAAVRLQDRHVVIQRGSEEAGRVPIEDMAVLVLDGPDLLVTHQLLGYCADAGVAIVSCDEKHMPVGLQLPLGKHSLHSAILRDQIEAGVPAQKRVWQAIVRAKVRAQADLVAAVGGDAGPLRRLATMVRSGDPDNIEATAAARYFEAIFGGEFIRDREAPGINCCLNYGYAVIRSAVARAVVGAGLHPALGVFHRNQYNAFCLVDDAMEPFRPMVDRVVREMALRGEIEEELTPPIKRRLVQVMGGFVRLEDLRYPFLVGLERFAAGLRRAICEGDNLVVPLPCDPPNE